MAPMWHQNGDNWIPSLNIYILITVYQLFVRIYFKLMRCEPAMRLDIF
jgi:hypothetical protein